MRRFCEEPSAKLRGRLMPPPARPTGRPYAGARHAAPSALGRHDRGRRLRRPPPAIHRFQQSPCSRRFPPNRAHGPTAADALARKQFGIAPLRIELLRRRIPDQVIVPMPSSAADEAGLSCGQLSYCACRSARVCKGPRTRAQFRCAVGDLSRALDASVIPPIQPPVSSRGWVFSNGNKTLRQPTRSTSERTRKMSPRYEPVAVAVHDLLASPP